MAVVVKVTTAWKESSCEMKRGSTIKSQIVNVLIHPPRKSSKCIQLQESLCLQFFWDLQWLLLEHYQERGSAVNSAYYSEMQCDEIKPAI